MADRQRLRLLIGGREADAKNSFRIALASAALLAISACAAVRQQLAALSDLTNALSHQFGQQFTINLNATSGVLAIAATMAPDGRITQTDRAFTGNLTPQDRSTGHPGAGSSAGRGR